jgi:phosphoglycolate phosphatase
MIKYIVFDFDGTLVDSKWVAASVFNEMAEKYKFAKIDDSNIAHLKTLSMLERMKFLKVPLYRVPFLTHEFFSLYQKQSDQIPFIPGVESMLEKLKGLNFKLAIVSSNALQTINAFLNSRGVTNISEIYCSNKIFGKDKVLRKFLKANKLQASEVLYVCDELRDLVACRKVSVKTVWVSWGFETKTSLRGEAFDFTADTPDELFAILQQQENDRPATDNR